MPKPKGAVVKRVELPQIHGKYRLKCN
jgi:hypothetical protein